MSSKKLCKREDTKEVIVGGLFFGESNRIYVESMTKTKTDQVLKTTEQIKSLYATGCDIVRVAVPDDKSLASIPDIISSSPIPIIPDIHFNYKLALAVMDYDIGGVRINPGNIGSKQKVREVVEKARNKNIHIRVGVNAGSLSKKVLEKYKGRTAEAMYESAAKMVEEITSAGFDSLVVSLKSSDVKTTVDANLMFADKFSHPLHLGITEAGFGVDGISKSSVGLGLMLNEGIGNSIRVSLTGPPETEIKVGIAILRGMGLYERGVDFISCPICGRCEVDLLSYVLEVKRSVEKIEKRIKVAVMGCEVNGPGEAADADVGIAFGKRESLIFMKGEIVDRVENERGVELLMERIEELING